MQPLNLQKGISLNLNKEFGLLDKVNLGLGWDITNGQDMDLDAFAIMFDKNGERIGTTYYGRKQCLGVSLSGDNRTGAGDGDDETIYVNLRELNSRVAKISFFVNIFSPGRLTFKDIDNAFIRLIDAKNNVELAKFVLTDTQRNFNAFHFADLIVQENEFMFNTIGEGLNGSISNIEKQMDRQPTTDRQPVTNSNEPTPPKAKRGFFGLFK